MLAQQVRLARWNVNRRVGVTRGFLCRESAAFLVTRKPRKHHFSFNSGAMKPFTTIVSDSMSELRSF